MVVQRKNLTLTPDEMRAIRYDDAVLPLLRDRVPLAGHSEATLAAFSDFLMQFPEAAGRIARAVQRHVGLTVDCPTSYVLHEAHIDISESDRKLEELLLSKGFEPDHFSEPNPIEYQTCFTARFEIASSTHSRSRDILQYARLALQEVEAAVLDRRSLLAYSEIETASDRTQRKYQYAPPTDQGLEEFPFRTHIFLPLLTDKPKKWDVHVKVPLREKGAAFASAGSVQATQLRVLLHRAGFYEIRSLSGNSVFTVQMIDAVKAKRTFLHLANWADTYGGVSAITLEVCHRLWRSCHAGSQVYAPVPQIVDCPAFE